MQDALPPPGLVWFWFLNADCRLEDLRVQLAAFARARVGALVLHPRAGLLVPYGGEEWFALVRTLVRECVACGIQPWLYDEAPYPSGSAGGWIVAEHPGLQARRIERFAAAPGLAAGELFVFPTGSLLWAGLLPPDGAADEPITLTARVGTLMRQWEATPWDSRWYYPTTPLYPCARAEAAHPEFALRVPEGGIPPGWRLVAHVARPIAGGPWGAFADPLDPRATALFIARTHERYAEALGGMLGREVPAIFTDEPKPHSTHAWTPGLCEDFAERFGYDLRPRLDDLFQPGDSPRAMLTRLHYRQWLGERFRAAWLRPVADWCARHGLALVGHISPEDDPVEQANSIGDLFPLQGAFALAGLDLIIPALGDERHALLNVGVTCAASATQQLDLPGTLSESLGVSGLDFTARAAARILAWQTMSGVGTIVVHGAFASTLGLRRHDAPPDFGPASARWRGMGDIQSGLLPFQALVNRSTQLAPVAILWPIRGFQADPQPWLAEDTGPRRDLTRLLLACLQAQVGVHLIDEERLIAATLRDGRLRIGRADYGTLLLPSVRVIAEPALRRLRELEAEGVAVHCLGDPPAWVQHERDLRPLAASGLERVRADDWTAWCRERLPRLLPVSGDDARELRASAWTDAHGTTTWLLMNLLERAQTVRLGAQDLCLAAGALLALRGGDGGWRVQHTFDPATVDDQAPAPAVAHWSDWRARWPGAPWRELARPLAAYQLEPRVPAGSPVALLPITGWAGLDGQPVADMLAYSARLRLPTPGGVVLVFEPTAQRGSLTIVVGERRWQVRLADTGTAATRIALGDLPAGEHEIAFLVESPMPLDGIKMPPLVERA